MLMPAFPRQSKSRAATPECDRIPIPTTLNFATPLLVIPSLSFEQEGGHYGVRWSRLEVAEGTAEVRDGGLLVPARTKRISFKGSSDPASHPVEAGSAAVFVDVVAKSVG